MQEMQVQSLGQENPLEKDMETHSSISCLENPIDSGAWQATVLESDVTEQLSTRVPSLCLGCRLLVCFSAFRFLGAHLCYIIISFEKILDNPDMEHLFRVQKKIFKEETQMSSKCLQKYSVSLV